MKSARIAIAIAMICSVSPAFCPPSAPAKAHQSVSPAFSPPPASAKAHQDPRAVALIDAMEKAVDPERSWNKIAGLRFTQTYRHDDQITGEFRHTWDIKSGLYRVQGKAKDGGERDVIFNPATRKGEGWTQAFIPILPEKGKPMPPGGPPMVGRWFHPPGGPQTAYLKFGYERYLNDTYWFLLPLKLKDPRIGLELETEESIDGEPHDVVRVVLPKELELTAGRTFWIYVNRKTHLIDQWEYPTEVTSPQPASRKDPRHKTTWLWQDWKSFGPFHLSALRFDPATGDAVGYKDVEVLSSIPEKASSRRRGPARPS